MDLYLRETVFTKQCIDLKWLPCSEAFCQKDPMLLLSNKSILDTAQWSHNAQSFSSYIRFVGSGYSRLFLPPEGTISNFYPFNTGQVISQSPTILHLILL